jgi:hypothetical protein
MSGQANLLPATVTETTIAGRFWFNSGSNTPTWQISTFQQLLNSGFLWRFAFYVARIPSGVRSSITPLKNGVKKEIRC